AREGVRRARNHHARGWAVPHRHRRPGRPVTEWERTYSGKVRDLYESAQHPDTVLMVASDRVSAFDHVLEPGIPGKGELLTQLSLWWFAQFPDVRNHLVSGSTGAEIPAE